MSGSPTHGRIPLSLSRVPSLQVRSPLRKNFGPSFATSTKPRSIGSTKTSTPSPIQLLATGRSARTKRALLDTSVAIALEGLPPTLDFDSNCASAYERICAATIQVGRKVRGSRSIDLLIAATSLAHELPLYTRNSADLRGLDGLIEIVDLG